jgi:hypothetical protein
MFRKVLIFMLAVAPLLSFGQSPWRAQNSYLTTDLNKSVGISPSSSYWGAGVGYVFGESNFDDNVAINGSFLIDAYAGAINLAVGTNIDASLTQPAASTITAGLYPWQRFGSITAYGGAEFSADGNLDNKAFTLSAGAEYGLLTNVSLPLTIGILPFVSFADATTFGSEVTVVVPLLNGVGLLGSVEKTFDGQPVTFELGLLLVKPF